jgi:hypothetical protein
VANPFPTPGDFIPKFPNILPRRDSFALVSGGGTHRKRVPACCLPKDRQECLSHMWNRHSCLFIVFLLL